jgi:hypothetical protein
MYLHMFMFVLGASVVVIVYILVEFTSIWEINVYRHRTELDSFSLGCV